MGKLRLHIRLRFGNYTFTALLIKTQWLKGLMSKVQKPNKQNLTYIFWDLEGCTEQEAKDALSIVQLTYKLGNIVLYSDKPKSYRAMCFSIRSFREYLRILLDTSFVCYNFFYWTVRRGCATIRISNKLDRTPQKIIALLEGYELTQPPENIQMAIYETGAVKTGRVITNAKV